MCAIAGILSKDQDQTDRLEAVLLMLHRTRHRGPDDEGLWEGEGIALGARRLAQLDAQGGAQPMTSPDGRWTLVFNGEIHNHRTLREVLRRTWNFRTRSDTEVLLAALVTWGETALLKLNGMFAFFLWDHRERKGLAARDRLGVKPFVYLQREGCFAFASEAKALLDLLPGRPTIHAPSLLEYWIAPCFSGVDHPMFESLEHLAPGHLLRIDEESASTHLWWSYDLRKAVDDRAEELAARLHELLKGAVAACMDADHAPAVFLSGGLDSTLVAGCAKKHGAEHGYTIVFEGQAGFDYATELMVKSDDVPSAQAAARELGVQHHLVPVSRAALAEDLRTLAIQNDALPAWEQELAQYHLSKAAAHRFRAVLVGDAADETHYGYGFLLNEDAIRGPGELLRRFGVPALRAGRFEEAQTLLNRYAQWPREAGHEGRDRASRLRATTHLVVQRWLPRLLHNGDVHTMAHGLEARVPFADIHLLDLAVQVHPELGLHGGVEKWLLREAARGLMPEASRVRSKSSLSKDSACAAVYQEEAAKALRASAAMIGAWLDIPVLHRLCAPSQKLTEAERGLLFRVICFHHWAEHYNARLP